MIYLLKFVASFILPPGIFIVLFLLIAFVLWKRERFISKCLVVVTVLFYLISIPIFADHLIGSLESRYEPPENLYGDVIIMLGGGATSDTPDINGLGNLRGNAANRFLTAARLQRKLDIPIILSGGQVYSDSGAEALIAKRMLLSLGVDAEKIFVDTESLNTKQNAQMVRNILAVEGFKEPILVTSAFHMERSLINFRKANVEVTPYPADYMVNRRQDFYWNRFAPNEGALSGSCMFFREALGILAARILN